LDNGDFHPLAPMAAEMEKKTPPTSRITSTGTAVMQFYANLVILALVGVLLSAYLSFQVYNPAVSFVSTVLSYVVVLLATYLLTKKDLEHKYGDLLKRIKRKYTQKIHNLKRDHDTSTLERTIRNGTQTLIKNAIDYFKIDNIKNEMGSTAAIQNLQLDKYGQIIELLADFSLILPDYEENRRIVQQEIHHQIDIYEIDEKPFAQFLMRILEKYRVTFNKKLREREEQNGFGRMKTCPKCAEKVWPKAKVCRHCGHRFNEPLLLLAGASNGNRDLMKRARLLFSEGKHGEAVDIYTKAIDADPQARQAYYNRGIIFLKLDNEIQGIEDLKAAACMGHKKASRLLEVLRMMKTQDQGYFPKTETPSP
jgi:tetratricopeptide (TPR) repeat protein